MSNLNERVATLEANHEHMDATLDKQTEILERIEKKLNKQAGFISGVMFVFTGLVGAVALLVKIAFGK